MVIVPTCDGCLKSFDSWEELGEHQLDCSGDLNDDPAQPELADWDDGGGAFENAEEAYDNHDWDAADG